MRSWLLPLAGALHLLLVVLALGHAADAAPGAWVGLDPLSRLVLLVTSLLFLGCAFYAVDYLEMRRDRGNRVMVPCLLVFLAAHEPGGHRPATSACSGWRSNRPPWPARR